MVQQRQDLSTAKSLGKVMHANRAKSHPRTRHNLAQAGKARGGDYSASAATALFEESSGMPGPIEVLIVALVM